MLLQQQDREDELRRQIEFNRQRMAFMRANPLPGEDDSYMSYYANALARMFAPEIPYPLEGGPFALRGLMGYRGSRPNEFINEMLRNRLHARSAPVGIDATVMYK